MSRPHATKPFPEGFFNNSKLKKQHVFAFDILCRHLDADAEDWIRTDSISLIRLLKKTAGLNVQTPKKLLSSLQEWGYIEILEPSRSRTVDERNNCYTLLAVRILQSAWDPKEVVRAYTQQNRDEYMRIRYEKRKAIQVQVKALLEQED